MPATPATPPTLDDLLANRAVWRCGARDPRVLTGVPTGFGALDAALPEGGWRQGALTELLGDVPGVGELALLLPALARETGAGRGVLLIGPPCLPYPPAWQAAGIRLSQLNLLVPGSAAEHWSSAELALRSGACAAVLVWEAGAPGRAPRLASYAQLRRLQVAASHGTSLAVLFRPAAAAGQPSPASLRLVCEPVQGLLRLRLLKRRGMVGAESVTLDPYPANFGALLRTPAFVPEPVAAGSASLAAVAPSTARR